MKRKKAICIVILAVGFFWSFFDCLAYLNFSNFCISDVNKRNYELRDVIYELLRHAEMLNIPKNADIVLEGEFVDSGYSTYFLVYQNAYLEDDLLLSGNPPADSVQRNYWAVKVGDSAIKEAWYGEKPLTEESMRPYTLEEQRAQIRFSTFLTNPLGHLPNLWHWYDDDDMIGYFEWNGKVNFIDIQTGKPFTDVLAS